MKKTKQKIFTLQEANAILPELLARFQTLRSKKESYSRLHDALFVHELVCAAERSNGFFEKDDLEENIHNLEQAIEDLAKEVEAIFATGCILRNLEKGTVEFPGVLDGRNVFWCWESGESAVLHYRPADGNSGGRFPIP